MVNFPVFFTSAVASATRPSTTPATAFFVQATLFCQSRGNATLWQCCDCLL